MPLEQRLIEDNNHMGKISLTSSVGINSSIRKLVAVKAKLSFVLMVGTVK